MAQLNLRDRTLETTIAYVGGGAAASFARLADGALAGGARTLVTKESEGGVSFEWRPRERESAADYGMAVTIVPSDVPLAPGALARLLADVDALVLVLDAAPGATERNAGAAEALREALAHAGKTVPVVVRLEADDDAPDEPSIAPSFPEEWARVRTSAAKGEGVMETLHRAVDAVVGSMRSNTGEGENGEAPPRHGAAPPTANPLLTALRHVVRASVGDEVAALEARLAAAARDREANRENDARALAKEIAALGERLAPLGARLAAVDARITRLESSFDARLAKLEATATATDARAAQAEERTAAAIAAQRDAVLGELREMRKPQREELSRLAASVQPLPRALEALTAEVKKWATEQSAAEVGAALDRLDAKADGVREGVESLSAQARTLATRVDETAARARQGEAVVSRRVAEIEAALTAFAEAIGKRDEALKAAVDALTEELRKKKKGWF